MERENGKFKFLGIPVINAGDGFRLGLVAAGDTAVGIVASGRIAIGLAASGALAVGGVLTAASSLMIPKKRPVRRQARRG